MRTLITASMATLCLAVTDATATLIDVVLNAYSEGAGLDGGSFSLDGSVVLSVYGSEAYVDYDLDGFSDDAVPYDYDADFTLGTPYYLLTIDPGNVTPYHSFGPITTSFDWALTAYEEPVGGGGLLTPVSSVMWGSAAFEVDRTLLHVSEGLMWGDGLLLPGWAGYHLADFTALELTALSGETFDLQPVPAPATIGLLPLLLAAHRRRRR